MWEGMKWCARQGCASLHLGRTSLANEGLRRFKSGWGAQESKIDYFNYDLRRDAFVVDSDRANGWYNRMFGILPCIFSRLLGNCSTGISLDREPRMNTNEHKASVGRDSVELSSAFKNTPSLVAADMRRRISWENSHLSSASLPRRLHFERDAKILRPAKVTARRSLALPGFVDSVVMAQSFKNGSRRREEAHFCRMQYAVVFGERARLGRYQPAPPPVGPATEPSLNGDLFGMLGSGWRGANHGARGGRAPLSTESLRLSRHGLTNRTETS